MDACKSWYLITTQERSAQLLIAKDDFNMAEVDAEKDSAPMMSYSGSKISIWKYLSIERQGAAAVLLYGDIANSWTN